MTAAVIVKIVNAVKNAKEISAMKSNEELKTENVEVKETENVEVKETEKPIEVKETESVEVKENKNIDYENLRKEFEKLQTQMNEIQKNNLKLQAQNTELHKKVVNEAIEPSEGESEYVEPYNAFDPST